MWKSVFCTEGKNILSKKMQINLFNIFKKSIVYNMDMVRRFGEL